MRVADFLVLPDKSGVFRKVYLLKKQERKSMNFSRYKVTSFNAFVIPVIKSPLFRLTVLF